MDLQSLLTNHIQAAFKSLYQAELSEVEFQATRKEFEGDITVVVFPMLRVVKGNPVAIGEALGAYLEAELAAVTGFNVIKGFLNLSLSDAYFYEAFEGIASYADFGHQPQGEEAVIVEYSSPNTNKPLHLGHIRNILLGYSVAEILKAAGKKVYKTQIINDRGIHICKSMLAWKLFGEGETPASSGLKGDHLVGKYYVKFDQEYKAQQQELIAAGKSESEAKEQAPLLLEAQQMLRKWEAGDPETVALWETMNGWVYQGFDATYEALGVDFDTLYYESNTYLLGKENIEEGLSKGVFFKKEDGSVWCNLTDEGLDEKLVLRSDGTAVYMTQDIGTAIQRIKDMPDAKGMIYTVGNEQDYHFKVLFLILKKLGYSWAENLFHLSYGMVDLPSGKMKSREGTVVDADDLIEEMATTAGTIASELGKLDGYTDAQKQALYQDIGLGALKYYILKVDPKKRILFDPEASVDFQGNTGPFIQYTYARIQAILRKAATMDLAPAAAVSLTEKERAVIKELQNYPVAVNLAAAQHSPALIANYVYDLVKAYNSFFQNVPIFAADSPQQLRFRVSLSQTVGKTIEKALSLLGIAAPERM
ncbi:arginine--tRNA ligase [Gilvibacter sp.]|uniref:arginine--tRNA ligase n=1 Tax=Gilvibacter sp. TaxID=2729997 RepID=UPI0025BD6A99|nr:arginine--tRNA ligase [Gilvibacter sp.]NQX77727.1 arginine--tRNA ligase [Gilvibacter sp.]